MPVAVSSLALFGMARGLRGYVMWGFIGALQAFVVLGVISVGRFFAPSAVLLALAGVLYLFASDTWWDAVLMLPAIPLGASTLAGSILIAGSIAARRAGRTIGGREDLESLVLRVFVGSLVLLAIARAGMATRRT